MNKMWWQDIVDKYAQLEKDLSDPHISKKDMVDKSKLMGSIQKDYDIASEANKCFEDVEIIESMIDELPDSDKEMQADLMHDKKALQSKMQELHDQFIESKLSASSIQSIILEIRAGAGGDEASLFAYSLLEMYLKYAQNLDFEIEIMSKNMTDLNGLKEVILHIKGQNAYEELKFESGVHRVQRVPKTEASGRIHTSTATVAVLEEREDVEIEIKHDYLKVDVYRSSGPGGQSVNTTDSAVRLTYTHPELNEPVVVCMQDEKSQHKNKDKAMKILKTRLSNALQERQQREIADNRKSQVGSGDRSERIRTYNFPQDRITDHRSKVTLHGLNDIFLIVPATLQKLIDSLKKMAVLDETEQ